MTGPRKRYSAQDKIELLRLHLLEQLPVPEICTRHKIHPTIFYRWQRQLFIRGRVVFQGRSQTRLLANLRRKLTRLKKAEQEREKELRLVRKQLQERNALAVALQKFAAPPAPDVAYSPPRGKTSPPVQLSRKTEDDESNSVSAPAAVASVTKLSLGITQTVQIKTGLPQVD
jgi:transposase